MAEPLVTLPEAKAHLNVTVSAFDGDIQSKIETATVIVLERCNSTAYWRAVSASWTADTVPLSVKAAILLVLGHLFQHRGDDMTLDAVLWTSVDRLLGYHRDPVVA